MNCYACCTNHPIEEIEIKNMGGMRELHPKYDYVNVECYTKICLKRF